MTAHDSLGEHEKIPKDLPKEEPIPHARENPKLDEEQDFHDVKTLLSWSAPGRPFKKRSREYYLSSLLIMLFVEIILFLFAQYLLMLVVASLVFLAFSLATIPPHDFHYRISSEGIMVEDYFYLWQELYDFHFKTEHGSDVLHIQTQSYFPGELIITLGSISKNHIRQVLLPYLPYREFVKPTFMDKSSDWLAKNFPLEKEKKVAG